MTITLCRWFRLAPVTCLLLLVSVNPGEAEAVGPAGEWTNFTNKNIVTSLAIAGDSLWAGTTGGVVLWDLADMTFRTFTSADGLASSLVRDICIDGHGRVLFATDNGVSRFDGANWTSNYPYYEDFEGLRYYDVLFIARDSGGRIILLVGGNLMEAWFGFEQEIRPSISYLSRSLWINEMAFETGDYQGERLSSIRDMVEDMYGNAWYATDDGVMLDDGGLLEQFSSNRSPLINENVFAAAVDSAGALWFGTEGGISRKDGETWTDYTEADGLPHDWVWDIEVDGDGVVWCGTEAGAASFDGSSWTAYGSPAGLDKPRIYAVAVHSDGSKYFGTEGYGLLRFKEGRWSRHTVDGPSFYQLGGAVVDGDNVKYFGHQSGILRYDDGGWSSITEADGLESVDITGLAVDSSGNLWTSTRDGVGKWDGRYWLWYDARDGLAADDVRGMVVDRGGDVWFATVDGISRYDGKDWTNYTTVNSRMHRNLAESAEMDFRGHLWFGSKALAMEYDGLEFRNYVDTRWIYVKANGDTLFHFVRDVIPDPRGSVWFNAGYDKVAKFDYNTNFWSFDPPLPVPIMNHHLQAMTIDRSNNIWMATSRGLGYYDGTGWQFLSSRDGPAYSVTGDIALEGGEDGTVWLVHHWGVSRFRPAGTTSIGGSVSEGEIFPDKFALHQNYPNPFNPETVIEFALPRRAYIRLEIYNVGGQLIRVLKDGPAPAGIHRVRWDGKDDNGEIVPSGVYFYRLESEGYRQTRSMVILK